MSESEYKTLSDEKLVELIKQNDTNAFQTLYYRYFHQLYRYAYYRLYENEITRDLIQDLFSRVWRNRKNLDADKSIKSYLYRSLTNIIINYSNLASSKNLKLSEISENSAASETDYDSEIDLQSAIDQLSEKLKLVYLLSRVEGYKYSEIAEILNISVKAVEKRMSKALRILRNKFL